MGNFCMWKHIAVAAILVNWNLLNVLSAGEKMMKEPSVLNRKNLKASDLLNGINVRFSLYEQIPLLSIKRRPSSWSKNNTYIVEGLISELIEDMVQRYNMTYQYVLVDPVQWLTKGAFDSLINQLLRNEADIAAIPFPRTFEYFQKIYLGCSGLVEQFTFLQPFPQMETRLTAPIRPFTSQVWLLFIISNIMVIMVMTTVTLLIKRQEPNRQSFSKIIYKYWEYVVTILLAQGNSDISSSRLSLRLLVGLWLLMMVVVINAYTGTLTSFLTSPKLEPTVDNFDQLIERGKTLTMMKGLLNEIFLNASSGLNKIIGDKFRAHPELLFTDYKLANAYILRNGYVFFGPELVCRGMMDVISYRSDGNKCLVTLATKPLPFFREGTYVGMRKEWPYKEIIDQQYMQYMWESGISVHRLQKYFPKNGQCNPKQHGKTESFTLEEFTSIFFILIIGLAFSFSVFFFELMVGYVRKKDFKLFPRFIARYIIE